MQPIIPPTIPTNPAVQPVTSIAPVDVTVSSTPPNINQLLRQIQVSGTISSAPDNGNVTLTTSLGNFTFSLSQLSASSSQQTQQQLDALFQSQKSITVTIQPGSPPTQAVLLLPTTVANVETNTTNLQPVMPQPVTITPGASLPAVVLPQDIVVPGSGGGNTAGQNSTGQNSTGSQLAAGSTPQGAAATAAPTTSTTAPTNLQQNAPAPILQAGKEVMIQVSAVAEAGETLPEPGPGQVTASVIGNGANGQLILKTADNATLYVRASVEAPVGTSLLVKIEPQKTPLPTVLPQLDSQNFSSLQQTLDAVAQINPQLAQQVINSRVPQPNAQLAGPLLFFLSALKQGDAKGWLGSDVADALARNGKLELLARLGSAMESSGQTEHDPAVGEWKSYPVPMHNNGQFQTLTLHVHRDGKGASEAGEPTPQQVRFLIDVRMSKLGSLQLDGLVRPKKLDMIVRSEGPLPAGLPQELRGSYLSTIEALGYTGGLSFQSGRQHWLTPYKETPQANVTR